MKKKRVMLDYNDKKLELKFRSVSAHLQACMIQYGRHASALLTMANAKFLRSVACLVPTLLELSSLLLEAQIS